MIMTMMVVVVIVVVTDEGQKKVGKDGQNWRGLKRNAIRVFENC